MTTAVVALCSTARYLSFLLSPPLAPDPACTILSFALPLLFLSIVFFWSFTRAAKVYPPGPPRKVVLGNFLDILHGEWYETFTRWQRIYGAFVYAAVPGMPTYVVNSHLLAEELIGKGTTYAGRPQTVFMWSLMGWEWSPVLMNPSKDLNKLRAYMRQALGPRAVSRYRPIIHSEVMKLLKILVGFEADPADTINRTIGTIIAKVTYGDEIFNEYGHQIINANREALEHTAFAQVQFWSVDVLPFLRYLPSWLPGTGWKTLAARTNELVTWIRFKPWEFVTSRMNRTEGYEDCMVTHMVEKEGKHDLLRDAIAILYVGGTDTTHCSLMIFLLCMVLYPTFQKYAQEEIDKIVGRDRMPGFDDLASLPYVMACWKESKRWRPALPLGIPRISMEGNTFKGYWIPKGAMIHPNIGFMLRDPSVWDQPDVYNPGRFLVPLQQHQPDPSVIGFGFGRRICPGRFLSEEIGPCIAVALLWAFNMKRLDGPASQEEVKWVDSAISPPYPFKVAFQQRSEKVLEVFRNR